jgi:hypothetical protein
MMDRSRSKGDYFRTLERRISDLQKQVDVLNNRDQSIDWINVGASGAPAFSAGWSNYGGGWHPASFSKDSSGTVYLRGLLIGPAAGASLIFTLPAGFIPSAHQMWWTEGTGASSRIDVHNTGQVIMQAGNASGYYSINPVIFRPT